MSAELVARHLVCPKCHSAIVHAIPDGGETLACARCAWRGAWRRGVAVAVLGTQPSFFDDKVEVMQAGLADDGTAGLFRDAQMRLFAESLRPGSVVLDVGCGPATPYQKPRDCTVIGVDMSLASLRANDALDLRVYASAAELPLADRSVNTVLCAYSVHHFVGATVTENEHMVEEAFREFGRVLVRGGELFVFDVSPRPPFGLAQRALWNSAKRVLGSKLDMFFWRADALADLSARCLPQGSVLATRRFDAPWWSTFPPVFALPKLRVPRALYPFDVCMVRWKMPA